MAGLFAEGEEFRMGFSDEEDSSAGVAETADRVWAVLSVLAAGLLGVFAQKAKVGAESEALDADLKRRALAMEQMFEERLQTEGAVDILVDLFDFVAS